MQNIIFYHPSTTHTLAQIKFPKTVSLKIKIPELQEFGLLFPCTDEIYTPIRSPTYAVMNVTYAVIRPRHKYLCSLGDTSGKWDPFHRPAAAFIRVFMVKAVNSEGKAYYCICAASCSATHG